MCSYKDLSIHRLVHSFGAKHKQSLNSGEERWRTKDEHATMRRMDEGRKRIIGMMAAILASLHMQTTDDLFGTPQGSPRTDKLIAASIQWAERIMEKIDRSLSNEYERRV